MNRALIIANEPPWPVRDGGSLRRSQLIRAFAARLNCDLAMLANHGETPDVAAIRTELNLRHVFCVPHRPRPKQLCAALSVLSGRPMGQILYSSRALRRNLRRIVLREQYDMGVLLGDVCIAQYAACVRNMPVLIWDLCDDVALGYFRRAAMTKGLLKRVYYTMQARTIDRHLRSACSNVDAILVISDKDGDRLRPWFSGPIVAVPNAIEVHAESLRGELGTPTMLFTGAMSSWANRDAVLFFKEEILSRVLDTHSNAVFRVVGTGADTLDLRNGPNVSTTGFVEQLNPFYAACDVFVCPLRTGTGIKNKVLDAMANGCAIVTTSIGAEGIAVTHERELLIADTAADFARCIKRLLANQELRTSLGANARRFIQHECSTKTMQDHLSDVLRLISSQEAH